MFDAYFGKEWSKSFVHDFLFTLSNNIPSITTNVISNPTITSTTTIAAMPATSSNNHHNTENHEINKIMNLKNVHNFKINESTGEVSIK